MSKQVKSVLNVTPHVLAQCSCGWEDASSINAPVARNQLFKHMRQNDCPEGRIEVGRTSHYKLFSK